MTKKKKVHLRLYRPLLAKAYFDQGFGLTGYIKYIIALFGISSLDVKATLIMAFFYALSCYFIGRLWFKYHLVDTETEIRNSVNPFVRDMRKAISKA